MLSASEMKHHAHLSWMVQFRRRRIALLSAWGGMRTSPPALHRAVSKHSGAWASGQTDEGIVAAYIHTYIHTCVGMNGHDSRIEPILDSPTAFGRLPSRSTVVTTASPVRTSPSPLGACCNKIGRGRANGSSLMEPAAAHTKAAHRAPAEGWITGFERCASLISTRPLCSPHPSQIPVDRRRALSLSDTVLPR